MNREDWGLVVVGLAWGLGIGAAGALHYAKTVVAGSVPVVTQTNSTDAVIGFQTQGVQHYLMPGESVTYNGRTGERIE